MISAWRRHPVVHYSFIILPEPTRLPVQHVVGLHRRDLGDGGENMRAVHCGSLQAVAVVDLPLACLSVYIELTHTHKQNEVTFACVSALSSSSLLTCRRADIRVK